MLALNYRLAILLKLDYTFSLLHMSTYYQMYNACYDRAVRGKIILFFNLSERHVI
jgi:hypothetical protein